MVGLMDNTITTDSNDMINKFPNFMSKGEVYGEKQGSMRAIS